MRIFVVVIFWTVLKTKAKLRTFLGTTTNTVPEGEPEGAHYPSVLLFSNIRLKTAQEEENGTILLTI